MTTGALCPVCGVGNVRHCHVPGCTLRRPCPNDCDDPRDERPSDHAVRLGRVMPCSSCQHDEHVMPCGAEILPDVFCRCRDVPVPGIYPEAAS